MKILLFAIVIELVGIVLGGAIYRNISRQSAILGAIVAVSGLIPNKNREREY